MPGILRYMLLNSKDLCEEIPIIVASPIATNPVINNGPNRNIPKYSYAGQYGFSKRDSFWSESTTRSSLESQSTIGSSINLEFESFRKPIGSGSISLFDDSELSVFYSTTKSDTPTVPPKMSIRARKAAKSSIKAHSLDENSGNLEKAMESTRYSFDEKYPSFEAVQSDFDDLEPYYLLGGSSYRESKFKVLPKLRGPRSFVDYDADETISDELKTRTIRALLM